MPLMPAVLGPNTRLNNFRLASLPAAAAAERPTHVRISIGGIDVTHPAAPMRVLYQSMTIRDLVFDAPNTCALTLYGGAPHVGQPIEVWINSDAPVLLFSGEIQTVDRTYKGQPTTGIYPVTAIDDTARANRRRPLRPYVNVSASTIAHELIAGYAPGLSSAGVEPNLPAVSITFDGSEGGMKGCLTALAKLIGGYWYFEHKTLYLFVTPPGPSPDPIDDTPGRFLHDPAIAWSSDKSQVRTRVYGKGASTPIRASIAAGTDRVPLENGELFNPSGGQAIAAITPDGAACRVLTYTGVQLGGGGGLVGPGASPSAPPALALADGTEIAAGVHRYAVTFRTAAGESLPGPIAAITVGVTAPPAVAPVPGNPTTGGAVDPGNHYYAVTFVTTTGETTTPAVTQGVTTTVGQGVPTPGATAAAVRKVTGNLAMGVVYRYKTTFTVTGGETLPGAASAAIALTAPAAPASVLGAGGQALPLSGGALQPGNAYTYTVTFTTASYETAVGPAAQFILPPGPEYTALHFTKLAYSTDARITGRRLYRLFNGQWRLLATLDNVDIRTYTDLTADANLGPVRASGDAAAGTPPGDQALVTIPTSGDPRAIGRKIYRSDNGAVYRLLTTIANTAATQYIDSTASVASGAEPPTTDTSGGASYQTVPLTGIAIGPANVTARRIYRSQGGDYFLLATIANNTQTTYTDTIANSALGAAMPTTNSAAAGRVSVSLPLGPAATTTGRTIYRSAANATPLQLAGVYLDNTTTSYVDTLADSGLGAAPPATDTSGLVQPNGQVPAGSTSLILANPGPFASEGGWAVVGNGEQVIRYTGKSATALTGIPAAGPGAIVASISYNSTVTAAPALVGVTGILEAIIRNSPVHVWVQRDDPAAQAHMATLDGGGDGVYEHIWSDERRSEASLIQVCDAQLQLYSRPLTTVVYASRDLKTKSGKTVAIALAAPAITETLTIQDVTISEIGIRGLAPKFTVTASQVHTSLESVLRMLIRKADA